MKFLLLLLGCISLTSFFYRSTFDCKIPKGLKCKSLYEIKNMVAQGVFDIDNLEKDETSKIKSKRRCILCYRQAKATQGAAVVNKSPKKPKKYLINLFKSKQSQGERKHT
ncbi:putative conjugative transfer protein [Orientia tsutsugamushi str. Sido]|nr:putative conjugative transfer protein [Orientia tsutsugamushi str. Sido]